MSEHQCKQDITIEQLFERVKDTEKEQRECRKEFQQAIDSVRKDNLAMHDATNKEVTALKEGHAEMKVYVKQIFEKLDDMKGMFSDMKSMFGEQAARYDAQIAQYTANQSELILKAQTQAVSQVETATEKTSKNWQPVLIMALKYLAAGGGIGGVLVTALKLTGAM